jgi:hypothetical protein
MFDQTVLARSDAAKDAGSLVLRYEAAVLRRPDAASVSALKAKFPAAAAHLDAAEKAQGNDTGVTADAELTIKPNLSPCGPAESAVTCLNTGGEMAVCIQ